MSASDEVAKLILNELMAAGVTPSDGLAAAVMVCGDILQSIDCPDCRRIAEKSVRKFFPEIIGDAMAAAAKRPQQSRHTQH